MQEMVLGWERLDVSSAAVGFAHARITRHSPRFAG
jgi:hypothetical protein